jgi:hypothetical protein
MSESDSKQIIFVPDKYVPLSKFISIQEPIEELKLTVLPDILQYIQRGKYELQIAWNTGSITEYLRPTGIEPEVGRVSLEAVKSGVYTVVSGAFKNDFPIVTHWDENRNNHSGGYRLGASDAPGLLDLDLESGKIINEIPYFDVDPNSPYTYLTGKYHLMSSTVEGEASRVPSYERYLGECFSLKKVTDLLAVWISDKALQETGYPLVYLNFPDLKLQSDIPIFQIVNNYIVEYKPGDASLATFILPPLWTASPKKPYPAIFTGYYDNNDNFYLFSGIAFINNISKARMETGASSIGILWNGGGSAGSRTLQLSAYHNLSLLFEIAEVVFSVDKASIVAVGGSRGGVTALIAAGNPYHDNYKIKYAICANPIVKLGYRDYGMANPTSPMIYGTMSDDTGYKYAWRKDWREQETNLTGEQILLRNLIGTMDKDIANEALSPLSKQIVKTVKERGTKIILYAGTHDVIDTKDCVIELAESLRSQGVELELQFGYRFGHSNVEDLDEHAGRILIDMMMGREIRFNGVSHYRRSSSNPEEWQKSEKFVPEQQPVFFEGPKKAALWDRAAINIVGAAGMRYHLKLFRIDEVLWQKNNQIARIDQGRDLFHGTFEQKTKFLEGRISYFNSYIDFDESYEVGMYLYELWYSLENSNEWIKINSQSVPQPGVETEPILQIIKEYPMISGTLFAEEQNVKFIGWGLSEY